jgi:hypothetical protein
MDAEWRRLEVDSVDRFVGSGVYYGATDTLPASTAASNRAPMHSIFPKRLWRSRLNCYRHPID